MKRYGMLLLAMVLLVGLMVGCGGKEEEDKTPVAVGDLADGVYYAEADDYSQSGWKGIVAIEVKDGKMTSVNWNELHRDGGFDKKTSSMKGEYAMVAKGGSQSEWHEQAELVEQFVLEEQSVEGLNVKDDDKTDAISGVSVTVGEFARLVNKALNAGPVEAGPYKDGYYYAEADNFDENSGWKETVDVTVMNGKIVAVKWNAIHEEGGTDKATRSKEGEYGMVDFGNAQAEWHEQALKAEQFLLEKQDPKAIAYGQDGKTDAISGVSIQVKGFADLVEKALSAAK